jgi:inositol phosphorylceramide mannosyltransferase catalytic subunit
VFHHIWLGGAELPPEVVAFRAGWRAHHPKWDFVLWTDQDLPAFRNQECFAQATSLAQKADIARYEILLAHGGVYVDTDFECLRNLEPALDGVEAFAGTEDRVLVSTGILGSVPGHPWFAALVDALPRHVIEHPGAGANVQTGPGLATDVFATHMRSGAPTPVIFAPELFYPYHFNELHRRTARFPEAYAVHHWQASWLPPAVT